MKVLKIAKQECANCSIDTCLLTDKVCTTGKKRCAYLEKCVVPLKEYVNNPNWFRWQRGINEYLDIHKSPK